MPLVAGPQYLGLAAAQEGGTTGIRARSRALGSAMEMRTRRGGMTMIGVLAYGSLITDPGPELAAITLGVTKDVLTPFPVEFARKSRKRSGAPTLVPVEAGGCSVRAVIFEVEVTASHVADIVYRREIHAVGSGKTYAEPAPDRSDAVRIARFGHLGLARQWDQEGPATLLGALDAIGPSWDSQKAQAEDQCHCQKS